ncbi:hypothetical protein SZN_08139 [Streptomyces zinciresistens K42]|uniref:Secreted protein n=1 Tax=Streptomyces zinciresistens K42 TaxID=700597 RepID=G2G814_9ACTN|nr:hypothetical protein [Streptomyces zinciresistens]EGX60302.1 hypothetical protein SZN_08139 [Streptomyces zinciresistens K42]
MRRIVATAVSLFSIAISTVLAAPYAAAAGPAVKAADLGVTGIGRGTSVRTTTDMKPIPGTDAPNTGLARPGDNVAAICFLRDNNNVVWVLSLNRNGRAGQQYPNTAGFIRGDQLTLPDGTVMVSCDYVSQYQAHPAAGIVQADMKPIPGTDAPNTGLARAGDTLRVYCTLNDSNNRPWQLMINTNGRAGAQYANTAGFLPLDATAERPPAQDCGAT